MSDVFISYSPQDSGVAERLEETLTAEGITVFFDRKSLVAGERYSTRIRKELEKAKAVVVLLSSNSKRDTWVEEELRNILKDKKLLVIPALLDSDAKNNWVWPLLADRHAVQLDDGTDVNRLAIKIKNAIQDKGHISSETEETLLTDDLRPSPRRRWSKLVILSAAALSLLVVGTLLQPSWYAPDPRPTPEPIPSSLGHDSDFIVVEDVPSNLPASPDWKTTTVETTDIRGNVIRVIIGVLWDPYRWVMADTNLVAIDEGERNKYPVEEVIKAFHNDEKRPIIVVGTASHENAKDHPDREVARAAARADKLVDVCIKHFINKPHIYSLNLGAYRPDKNPSMFSASERRVILLVIDEGEDSPHLSEEVRKVLTVAKEKQDFIFDARDYSLFDADHFRVVRRANF